MNERYPIDPAVAHRVQHTCRGCGQAKLHTILDLGRQPLANAFLEHEGQFGSEPYFPLRVVFCEHCALVQLKDVIDPDVLFRDYIYVTGTSETIANHNRDYADTVVDRLGLGPEDLVVEVASNDGSLLKCFQSRGVKTLGVEPAVNIARLAVDAGIETVTEFFDSRMAKKLLGSHGQARAVVANNVLAHVNDPRDFLSAGKNLLAADGLLIVEVPYLGELIDGLEYDTVYHEHICYFSISSLLHLYGSAGLSVMRIEHVPVHGGSIRIYAGRQEEFRQHAGEVLREAAAEEASGLTSLSRLLEFSSRVKENRKALADLLLDLKHRNKSVAGYGAPAKGNTLLNYCRIDSNLLPFTVDKSPRKVGLFTPGMHIPVLPVEALLERKPDFVLILAWNFAEEIMRQQQEYTKGGGQFIVPLPDPGIMG